MSGPGQVFMPGSVRIGRIAGTTIHIHITYLLLWIVGGIVGGWYGLLSVVLPSFACVLAHEFGHALAARAFKITTTDLTLGPIGGVAQFDRIPEKLSVAFLVAIAGPLVNAMIASAVLIAVKTTALSPLNPADPENTRALITDRLVAVNLFLMAVNAFPALPMDGGRVLRAVLAIRFGQTRAAKIAATIGQWTAFVLAALGLFYNPTLIVIAIFIYLGARAAKHTPLGW
jgi:Zn-dependent protease